MRFDPKNGNWTGDWPEVQTISKKWMQQAEAVRKERTFLLNSCPQRLLGHLERGRVNLEWKGEPPPSLWFRPSSPPTASCPLTFSLPCPHTCPEGLSPSRAALPVSLWPSRVSPAPQDKVPGPLPSCPQQISPAASSYLPAGAPGHAPHSTWPRPCAAALQWSCSTCPRAPSSCRVHISRPPGSSRPPQDATSSEKPSLNSVSSPKGPRPPDPHLFKKCWLNAFSERSAIRGKEKSGVMCLLPRPWAAEQNRCLVESCRKFILGARKEK